MVQPNRVIAESYKLCTGKFFALGTSFKTFLFNRAFVNVTLFMMLRRSTFSTFATATMTVLVDKIVNASPTVQTARRSKFFFSKTQAFHEL